MILQIGAYSHPDRKAWISVSKKEVRSKVNLRMWYETTIDAGGTLTQKDGNLANLQTQMSNLEAAAISGADIVLTSGGSPTHHEYRSSQTMDGVRLIEFNWLKGQPGADRAFGSGTEMLYRRSWQARFVARYLDSESNIAEWRESIRKIGTGGPRWISKGSITGSVQYQQVQQFTPITYIQRGFAVGTTSYPTAASAIFPLDVHEDLSEVEPFTADRYALNENTLFGMRWKYVMESSASQNAIPGGIP